MSQAQIKLPLNNTLPLERRVYDNLKNLEFSKERHDFIITRLVGILLVAVSVHFTNAFNVHAMKLVWALVLSVSIVFYTSFAVYRPAIFGRSSTITFYKPTN